MRVTAAVLYDTKKPVMVEDVELLDRQLQDTSSWINYFLDRDSRPGRLLILSGVESKPRRTSR